MQSECMCEGSQSGQGATFRTRARLLSEMAALMRELCDPSLWRSIRTALLLACAGALCAAITPIALKLVLDALSPRASTLTIMWLALIAAYVGALLMTRIATEWRLYWSGRAEQRMRALVASRLLAHLLCLPAAVHLEQPPGALSEAGEQGVRGTQTLLLQALSTMLPIVVELTVVFAVLLTLQHHVYLLVLLGAAVAHVLVFARGAADITDPVRRISAAHVAAHGRAQDSLLNVETLKFLTAEKGAVREYAASLEECEGAWRMFYGRRAANGMMTAGVLGASLTLTLTLGGLDVSSGAITLGDLVMIHAYALRLTAPLVALGHALRESAQALASMEALLSVLRMRTEETRPDALPTPTRHVGSVGVEFDRVSFSYASGHVALREVSFSAPAGSTIGIVGESGAGKSTLVRLLFRLYEPDAGCIRLDGAPIETLPLAALRRMLAIVPQDVVLFHGTVARNIAIAHEEATEEEIIAAAAQAGLHAQIARLPDAYNTPVGLRGLKLSGGERQRVAIARAVLRNPGVLVLDEGTSALDSVSEAHVLQDVRRAANGRTLLIVTHRLAAVRDADQILVMDSGAIVERGTHAQLLTLDGRYAQLWRAQQRNGEHSEHIGFG